MIYFENNSNSAAMSAWIGEKIDSNFSSDDAFVKFAYDKPYTSAGMTVAKLDLEDDFTVYMLAPSEFLADILS